MDSARVESLRAKKQADLIERETLAVKKWLVNALCIYPIMSKALISQTMQGARITDKTAFAWQSILEILVSEGIVYKYRKQTITVAGRQQYLTLYRLAPFAGEFITMHLPNQNPDMARRVCLFASNQDVNAESPAQFPSQLATNPTSASTTSEIPILDRDVDHITPDINLDTALDDKVSPDFWDD